jgi:hypothetical protein
MLLRLLVSTGNVVLSLVLGAIAVAMVGIHYPETLSMMIGWARELKLIITGLGLEPRYNVWVELMLEERQLLFMGFTIAARIALSLLTGIVALVISSLRGS